MNKNGLLIGLVGRAGSGKDTFASFLRDNETIQETLAIADKIKNILSDLYNIPLEHFYNQGLKNKPHRALDGKTPREAAIYLGGKLRHLKRDTWLEYAMNQALAISKNGKHVCITDVRLNAEADAIIKHGGVLIGIKRDNIIKIDDETENQIDNIIAEQCHIVVENNNSLEELRNIANSIKDEKTLFLTALASESHATIPY